MKPDAVLEQNTWYLVALSDFYCGIISSLPETTKKHTDIEQIQT